MRRWGAMAVGAVLAGALLSRCGWGERAQCEKLIKDLCEECPPTEGYEKIQCLCLENGTLTGADFEAEDFGEYTDAEAEEQCGQILVNIRFPSPEDAAYCHQSRAMQEFTGEDVSGWCDYMGWGEDGDPQDSGQ